MWRARIPSRKCIPLKMSESLPKMLVFSTGFGCDCINTEKRNFHICFKHIMKGQPNLLLVVTEETSVYIPVKIFAFRIFQETRLPCLGYVVMFWKFVLLCSVCLLSMELIQSYNGNDLTSSGDFETNALNQ